MKKKYIKTFLSILLFIIFLIIFYGYQNTDQGISSASIFRGNLHRTGVYNSNPIIKTPDVKLIYSSNEKESFTQPIISNNIIYVKSILSPVGQGHLSAIDINTGKLI
jgi:outer membrane protein assembly factor BamB